MQAKIPKINSNKTQRIELNWNETTTIKRYCYYCSNFEPDQCFYFDRSFRFVWGLCGTTKNKKSHEKEVSASRRLSVKSIRRFGNRAAFAAICMHFTQSYLSKFNRKCDAESRSRSHIPLLDWSQSFGAFCCAQHNECLALHCIALQMAWHIALHCHAPDNQPKRESLESNHRIKSNPNESN